MTVRPRPICFFLINEWAEKLWVEGALTYYKKAARHFEEDRNESAEALFMAAYLADRVIKNEKEAIELYKELKEKYPNTQQGFEADNYLAQRGVYNVN